MLRFKDNINVRIDFVQKADLLSFNDNIKAV